jgi:hypothetical protein
VAFEYNLGCFPEGIVVRKEVNLGVSSVLTDSFVVVSLTLDHPLTESHPTHPVGGTDC